MADLVIWDMQDYRELPYHCGVNLVQLVIKRGKIVSGSLGNGNVRKTQGLKD